MRVFRHPLIRRDLVSLVDHIFDVTQGDVAAAERRLAEVDRLFASIAENPLSGVRLSGPLTGWMVRHGGSGQRLTVVFRAAVEEDALYMAIIAFGGQDWMTVAQGRTGFAP